MRSLVHIDLRLKKCQANNGYYYHKIPRIEATKCKAQASRDISEACLEGFYTVNYLSREYQIMQTAPYDWQYIQIP